MLSELHVEGLGVIEEATVVLGPGMTALTGETGAGKTLLVEAIELLAGGRADPTLVRPGGEDAVVEGRFVAGSEPGADDGDDRILRRVVPAGGRSRSYVDGQMTATAAMGELASDLVDLHGQHAHQSLLAPATQRASLDAAGGIDDGEVRARRSELRRIESELADLGGDTRSRARELDLLAFQLTELDEAGLDDPAEDDDLQAEELRLGDATAQREAAEAAVAGLSDDGGVVDALGQVLGLVAGKPALSDLHDRLRGVEADLADAASEARAQTEALVDDPERLAVVGERRHLLAELRRKYGETLGDVIAYREETRRRHAELDGYDARAAALEAERTRVTAELAAAEEAVGRARREAAPAFAEAVTGQLQQLAMGRARFEVQVSDDPAGSQVTWLLGANPGEPTLPLAKVASGGELARTMLAARLVLSAAARAEAPGRTLVFDEVDAGIGGEAAVAVGRALAALGRDHQVLVVTHLPQVAAFAGTHLQVAKVVTGGRTAARVTDLDASARIVELSRMLSGQPGSDTARRHAEELLATAQEARP